jgi:hypothetical protein
MQIFKENFKVHLKFIKKHQNVGHKSRECKKLLFTRPGQIRVKEIYDAFKKITMDMFIPLMRACI